MAKYTINQIIKTTDKLFGAGFNTDKLILNMKVEDVLKIPKITTNEMQVIGNLQRAIKSKNFIAFLKGEEIEELQK
ncbi:MAG: hypothetical protein FWF46_06075 [Oscillospiraceae bacterium]|nr:hypothetical protein [Oscillospiraceae bacterium]